MQKDQLRRRLTAKHLVVSRRRASSCVAACHAWTDERPPKCLATSTKAGGLASVWRAEERLGKAAGPSLLDAEGLSMKLSLYCTSEFGLTAL